MPMTHSCSIGIIGGADGPTAIFVTGPGPVPWILAAAVLTAAAILVIRHFRKP